VSLTRFNVLGKVIEDGLLSLALLLRRIFGFSIERDTDREPVGAGHELDSASPVSKRIRNHVLRSIQLRDVVWRCVGAPDFGDRRLDDGFNNDFHGGDHQKPLNARDIWLTPRP
jgi:hypothetical protein